MNNPNTLSPELFNQLLKLPHIEIGTIKQINDEIYIYASSTKETTHCHLCKKEISAFYELNPEIKLRHLSVLNYKCYIILKPKRFLCKTCNKATTQSCCWYRRKAKATLEYENHILLSMINSTIEDVSQKEDISYAILENIINKNISPEINWNKISKLNCLGIDEISLKKGHKDFVTIISADVDDQRKVIAVLKDRKKLTVKDFF